MDEDLPSTSNQPWFSLESPPKIGSAGVKRPYASSSKSSPDKKRRKFPGPAGVLHNIIDFEDTNEDVELLLELENESCGEGERLFKDSVWKTVKKNFGMEILLTYNINWIEQKLETNSLHNVKVPFLAAIVSKIEWFQDKIYTVTLTLKDPRGEIKAVIVPELFDMFAEEIVIGAAVVLRSFGIFTMGLGKSHYVVISSNNLLAVFTKVDDKVQTCKPYLKQAQKVEERRRVEKIAVFPQNRKERNVSAPQGLGLNVFETETFDFDELNFDAIDHAVSLSQSMNSQENSVFSQEISLPQDNPNTGIPAVFQEVDRRTNFAVYLTRPNNLQENTVLRQEISLPVVSQENQNFRIPAVFQGDSGINFAASLTQSNNYQEDSVFNQETSLSVISQETSLPEFSQENQNTGILAVFQKGDRQMKPPPQVPTINCSTLLHTFSQKEEEDAKKNKFAVKEYLKKFTFVPREVQIQQETFEGIDNNSETLFVNSDVGGSERKSGKEEEALEAKKLAIRKRLKQFKYLAREVPPEVPTVVSNPTVRFISCSQDNSEDSQIQQETFEGIDNNSETLFVNSDVGGSERKSGKEEEALEAKKLAIRKRLKQFKYLAREVPLEVLSVSQDTSENSQIQQETFEGIDNNSNLLFVNSDLGNYSERKSQKEEEALETKKLAIQKRLKQFTHLAREVPLEVPTVIPNPAVNFISCIQETSENSQIQQEAFEGIDNNSNSLFVNSDVGDQRKSGIEWEALEAKKLAIRKRLKQFRYLDREVSPEAPTIVSNPAINFISCSQDSLENSQILQEAFDGIDTNSLFEDF